MDHAHSLVRHEDGAEPDEPRSSPAKRQDRCNTRTRTIVNVPVADEIPFERRAHVECKLGTSASLCAACDRTCSASSHRPSTCSLSATLNQSHARRMSCMPRAVRSRSCPWRTCLLANSLASSKTHGSRWSPACAVVRRCEKMQTYSFHFWRLVCMVRGDTKIQSYHSTTCSRASPCIFCRLVISRAVCERASSCIGERAANMPDHGP